MSNLESTPQVMRAVRIQPIDPSTPPYTATNPAPPSAIRIAEVPIPKPITPSQLLIRTKATTIIRDNLTWPELYTPPPATPAHPGNDFAGIVASIHTEATHAFKPGDEVYGMTHAHRGGAWADHVLVEASECAHKPRRKSFSWPQAAALTLSALTADQALFVHAKLDLQAPEDAPKRVLITGAAGGVGIQLVSMAEAAGHEVFGLTSNRARDEEFITSLGAREVMEYSSDLAPYTELFDAVIDTVGGDVLKACWRLVKSDGALISIDSASWDFVKKHEKAGLSRGKENVKAAFFIVEPEAESMKRVGQAVEEDGLTGLVARTMEFERVREAYELVERGEGGRGKVVLVFE